MARSCYIVILIKSQRPGTSFQPPALSEKQIRNVCQTAHLVFDQISL